MLEDGYKDETMVCVTAECTAESFTGIPVSENADSKIASTFQRDTTVDNRCC